MNISVAKNIYLKFPFQDTLTCVKCNYLWSHLQVQLDESNGVVTLFFYFSHIYLLLAAQCLGALPSPPIEFNLLTNFSVTRLMEFHRSVWFFRYQTDGIPSIWLIFQAPNWWNSIDLVIEISKHSASLHFGYELGWIAFLASETPQHWISREKTERITFKKSLLENWRFLPDYVIEEW